MAGQRAPGFRAGVEVFPKQTAEDVLHMDGGGRGGHGGVGLRRGLRLDLRSAGASAHWSGYRSVHLAVCTAHQPGQYDEECAERF